MRPVKIGASVMFHPKRRPAAQALAAQLADFNCALAEDPSPGGPPTSRRSALRAWSQARADTTHHLVLQDDVILGADFVSAVSKAAGLHPDCALVLYTNWNCWNGAAVRLAAATGGTWARAVRGEWVPTLALLLPRADAAGVVAEGSPAECAELPDDVFVQRYLERVGRSTLISLPNLVEHASGPSVMGHAHGPRNSVCFIENVNLAENYWQTPSISAPATVLPYVFRGRAGTVVLEEATGIWRYISWRSFLHLIGAQDQIEMIRDDAMKFVRQVAVPPRFGPFVVENQFAGAFIYGLIAGSQGGAWNSLVEECLETQLLGGLSNTGVVLGDDALGAMGQELVTQWHDGLNHGRSRLSPDFAGRSLDCYPAAAGVWTYRLEDDPEAARKET
ncbi:hypothetical protein GCM10009555_032240 [Acrocarpospora macrocephala]|uniref:Glycosyltransferase n=1 Tax=Acrocarpospora macrocephala TaxID=150177 RepID=A0A5M3WVX7_9ACTN|nr:hypothetical protein [Acrocarpospora macrocephala]GES12556.1 hypothetical protein Amac_061530 [Acrocarpospora macrocephala]